MVDIPYGQAFLFNTHNEAAAKLAFIFDKDTNLLVGAAAYAFPTTTCGPLMMLGQVW